jgi:hypothetical protein
MFTPCFCWQRDASVLETTILGPNGSTVKLTMRCREKGVVYDFDATRHVPIRVWDEVAVTRFLREDLIGGLAFYHHSPCICSLAEPTRLMSIFTLYQDKTCLRSLRS